MKNTAPKNVTPAPDATTKFLREVDEALQQERLLMVWHKSKWFLLAAVVLLVLSVAGQQAWLAWKDHQARTMANQWYAFSTLNADSARAEKLPEILSTTTGGTHALAVYTQAAMQHTPAEKAKAYQQVVTSKSAPQWLKDLARLNGAIALMESNPAEAKAQLELLAQAKPEELPTPAFAPALELLALMSQQAGDVAAAKGYTEKLLQMPALPSDMRQRALQRLGMLSAAG